MRHLEQYGTDGLLSTLENVFSFDIYDRQLREHLSSIFHRHGIPMDFSEFSVDLATEAPLPEPTLLKTWRFAQASRCGRVEHAQLVESGKWNYAGRDAELRGRTVGRLERFTEMLFSWTVESEGHVLSMVGTEDGAVHVLVNDPFQIHSYLAPDCMYLPIIVFSRQWLLIFVCTKS